MKTVKNVLMAVWVMISTLPQKCTGLHVHVLLTTIWAKTIGEAYNLTKKELKMLVNAARLHDLGKSYVWKLIMLPTKLTSKQRAYVNVHSVIGAIIVFFMTLSFRTAKIVFCHHDYIDGTGVNGIKVCDKLTQILTISDIIAARCYEDPTRLYPVELKTVVDLCEEFQYSKKFNADIAKIAASEEVRTTVADILATKGMSTAL